MLRALAGPLTILTCGLPVANAHAQAKVVTRKSGADKQASRLIRQMELPDRCSFAWRGLLAIGAAAAEPLARATQDPRRDVAMRAFSVLALLREDGSQALPILREHAAGKDADLRYAAQWAIDHIEFRGRLLVDWSRHTVEHLDDQGKVVRTIKDLKGPWHAEPCGNGNLLVSEYGSSTVREIDAKGAEVWRFKDLKQPYHAQRLPNGHTLISDASNNRVIEVDRQARIVWEKKDLKRPVAATRLPDGHTLIVENQGAVLELDHTHEEILRHKVEGRPMRAQRLRNGNTLITSHSLNQVVELDIDGRNVCRPIVASKAQVALRRRDGHTLISSTSAWFELDASGNEVWRRTGKYAVGVYW